MAANEAPRASTLQLPVSVDAESRSPVPSEKALAHVPEAESVVIRGRTLFFNCRIEIPAYIA